MFLKVFFDFIKEYGKNRKISLILLALFSTVMGFFEFLGLALIFPFVIFLSGDKTVLNSPSVKFFLESLNFTGNIENLFIILSILILLIYILKDILMILSIRFQNNIISDWQYDIFVETLENLIYAPYSKINSIPFGEKTVLLYSSLTTSLWNFVHKIILLFSNLIIAACILGFLFYKFAIPALLTSIFLTIFVLSEYVYFKRRAKIFGQNILKANTKSGNLFEFAMKGIKEIKVSKNRDKFINDIKENFNELNTNSKLSNSNGQYPIYITEIGIILSFAILSGLILYFQKTANLILPSIAVVAAIILRLVPVLNKLQNTLYLINQSKSTVQWFMKNAGELKKVREIEPEGANLTFENKITLKNVDYSYDDKTPVLSCINLEIKKGEFIGIVGLSGAGKTTLADILNGLNFPSKGQMFVDDIEITKQNVRSWHRKISILPQDFALMPNSVLQNVCFNDPCPDVEKAIWALKKANIYDSIKNINDIPELSTGQKHRIALARAFYQNADVLFLDEATSSLDIETEDKVAKSISALKGEKTIIAIAHRLSTLKECDRILYMKEGKIVDVGSFQELKEKHPDFENMIKLSNFTIATN